MSKKEKELLKKWRNQLLSALGGRGASRVALTKALRAKDIEPKIDRVYLRSLRKRVLRLAAFLATMDSSLSGLSRKVEQLWDRRVRNGSVTKFTNQGRRPEPTFYVWMQGKMTEMVVELRLRKSLPGGIRLHLIGGDNKDGDDFVRIATADFELRRGARKLVRLEIQGGMDGLNRHVKVLKMSEAVKRWRDARIRTQMLFFDYNTGDVFCVRIDNWRISSRGSAAFRGRDRRRIYKNGSWEGTRVIDIRGIDRVCSILEFVQNPEDLMAKIVP